MYRFIRCSVINKDSPYHFLSSDLFRESDFKSFLRNVCAMAYFLLFFIRVVYLLFVILLATRHLFVSTNVPTCTSTEKSQCVDLNKKSHTHTYICTFFY